MNYSGVCINTCNQVSTNKDTDAENLKCAIEFEVVCRIPPCLDTNFNYVPYETKAQFCLQAMHTWFNDKLPVCIKGTKKKKKNTKL